MQKTPAKASTTGTDTADISALSDAQPFIARWQGVALTAATELSTSQTFVIELCTLLGVPTPLPIDALNYVFERPTTFAHGDGSTSPGRIDCYRRGHLVWESKKLRYVNAGGAAINNAMLTARLQAENYARALPAQRARRRTAALRAGGRCGQRDRGVCRVHPQRRELYAVS